MNEPDYTLELADGTKVRVTAMNGTRHPDIKALFFPPGALAPFSHKNLPTARRAGDGSQSNYSPSF